jgi:hypothetical protein
MNLWCVEANQLAATPTREQILLQSGEIEEIFSGFFFLVPISHMYKRSLGIRTTPHKHKREKKEIKKNTMETNIGLGEIRGEAEEKVRHSMSGGYSFL